MTTLPSSPPGWPRRSTRPSTVSIPSSSIRRWSSSSATCATSGYQTWVVSGGGVEFIRAFSEPSYDIPLDQIVGSTIETEYSVNDGTPTLTRIDQVSFIGNGPGKPVGISRVIGRRPALAFGNSDGDYQMLQYTTAGEGPRIGLLLHHDDAEREFAYDRDSMIGRLDKGLDDALANGWHIVSMKGDFAEVFAPES